MKNRLFLAFVSAILLIVVALYIIKEESSILGHASADEETFRMHIIIPESGHVVEPGDAFLSTTRIFKIGGTGRRDILLEVHVDDPSGKTIHHSSQTLAIETQVSVVTSVNIPVNAEYGYYTIKETAFYSPEVNATASTQFLVVEKEDITTLNKSSMIFIALSVIISLLIIILAVISANYQKISKAAKGKEN